MSLRRLLAAATVTVVAVSALAGCGGGSDAGDQRADQVRAAAVDAGLEPEIADFLALAARGQTATYQATYPGPNPDTKLVVANDPPNRRVDVLTDDVTTEVRLVLDGEAFTCPRNQDHDAIETCTRTDAVVEGPGAFDDATLEQLTTSLRDRRDDFTFRIRRDTIAGVRASCLVTELKPGHERSDLGADGTICISPEGALLRVEQGSDSLEALDYTTEIPEHTFVRPDEQDSTSTSATTSTTTAGSTPP